MGYVAAAMPDPTTRPPPCPIHAACGACDAMTLAEEDQRAAQVLTVTRATGRAPDRVVASPRSLGYRARVKLQPGRDGALGYHRPGSHDPVPLRACAIARPEINRVLERLPPMPRGVASVELRSDGERVVMVLTQERRAQPELAAEIGALGLEGVEGLSGLVLGGRTLWGDARLRLVAGGVEHRVGPGVFFQVNLEVNALLVDAVVEQVMACEPRSALDLYAGYGNLGLAVAARGVSVELREVDGAAVAEAKRTAERRALPARCLVSDAARFRAGDAFFEVAIVDPPREGSPGLLGALAVTRPKRIVYVSCHPPALSRDLRPALQAGYRLTHLACFEMFPQTRHTEALAVLTRSDLAP